ncbi:hypothetical protein AGDE_15167 [Angomonas deanei]|uniref:Uncharacterized protein n=1 Tax=Angomonas deanei TaxID=59799 RepID=A0A7G2BZU5_9TRYP|nr:hypothetical protein AGDE_15167 [Angomonas deanei]CAD2212980.1 hypothetical protein, conserved [Angomonas deanei]|eukprot:EPY19598.1 hypothetical protein AGDE_15167 [Angomonas deanei]
MLSTVFFDSSEQGAGEAVRGITHEERPRYPEAVPGSPYQNAPSYVYPSFGCQGTVQVTELKASVSWWLDCAPDNNNNNTSGRLQNPRIVLLANNNNASASASKSCRNDLFTFEVPLQSSRHGTALLGCGVSRQAQGGNQLAITFVTNTLHVGYKMVSLHRDSPSGPLYFHTTIEGGMHHYFNSKARREFYRDSRTVVTVDPLLEDNRCASILDRDLTVRSHDSIEDRQTSGEQTIEDDEMRRGESRGVMWCAGALSRVAHAFSRTGKPTTAGHHDSSSRALSTIQETQPTTTFTYRQVTAVVVAEVPESQFTQNPNIIAFLVLTDGRTIWRVTLSGDGTVTETQFEDRFLKEMEQIDKHFSTKKFNNFSLLQPLFRYGTALLNPVYYEDARLRNAVQVDNLQTSTLPREAAWQERKEEIFQMLIAQQRDGGQAAGGAGGGLWGKLKSFTGASAATLKNTASLRLDFHKSMVGGKYYLGLSAVQESSLFLVCRANGFVEVFNVVDMSSSDVYPMCALPAELQESLVEQYLRENMPNPNANIAQLPPLPLFGQQWSVRLSRTNGIHFFVSLGLQNERRSVLGVIPQVEHCETQRVVLRNCFGVRPPTLTSTPMGCAFNVKVKAEEDASRPRGSTRVLLHEAQVQAAVLWDRGVEEEALVVEGHTIGSLFATTRESLSFVQVVEAKMTSPEMELNVLSTSCYAAQGLRSPLAALFSTENTFFVVDWSLNIIRAHAIRTHFPNLEDHRIGLMIETANIDNDDDVPMEFQNLRLVTAKYGLHWIPCVEESVEATAAGADPELAEDNEALQRCFREGISALESAGQGASFFVDLLQEILQGGSVVSGVSRVVSEDILSGFIPSKCVSNEDMCRAIRRVLKPLGEDDDDSGEQGFYSHSRVYLLHSVSTMLLQRVACVLVSYIGWFVSSGLSSPAPHPITDATVAVMEVLTATYHATLVAGPDLCRLATVSEMQRITSDTIAFAVVNAFLPPAAVIAPLVVGSASSSEVPSLESFLLQTAYLLRSGVGFSESCSAACTVYCNALCNRVPLLQHFLLLHQLDHLHSVRSTTSVVKLSIRSIPLALTQLIHLDQVNFLFYFGGLPLRGSGVVWCAPERQDAFHRQLKTFVSNASGTIPAVYLVGILRRVIVLDDNSSVTCRVNESLLSPLYMALKTVLRDCEKVPEGGVIEGEPGARRYGVLRDTLIELQVETLLCLARSHVESASIGQCCQCLEDCLALLPQCKGASVYSNCVDVIAASIVEAACLTISSPVDVMQKLVNVSTVNKELDDRIVSRWNHFIVRIPTSSANDATEARRRHAILGLYRFLMKRRSFAQCGRIFSDLASLLRSSTQRKNVATLHFCR